MACHSPTGQCDQMGCEVAGECPWPPKTAMTKGREMRDTLEFWKGPEGAQYAARQPADLVARYAAMWERIAFRMKFRPSHHLRPLRILEIGANVGANLDAWRTICTAPHTAGVEVNPEARATLEEKQHTAYPSTEEIPAGDTYDLTFTRGVLIHIPPEKLPEMYDSLFERSSQYIVVAEYYNPTPVEIPYRGRNGLLWKRDFAGEMLDRFAGRLRLVNYGFVYHRDPRWPQDDVTWFLMERTA